MLVEGQRQWVTFPDIAIDDTDFEAIGAAFAEETGFVRTGKVAQADALLMPQRRLVDFAVRWMEHNRATAR